MNSRWSSRSLGSRLQHGIFYGLIRLTGVWGGYLLLFFVVLWYALRPSVRNRSRAYIVRRFPSGGGFSRFVHTWRLQWTFGLCLVDRAGAGISGDFSFGRRDFNPGAYGVQKGKGLILLSAHTGCWQMAPFTLAQHAPVPVTVLAHRERDDVDRQAHEHAGREPPYAIIAAGSGPAATVSLAAALQRGEFVCMMGDRIFDPGEMGVLVAFLGGIVRLPVAAYRLASVCGVPLAVVFSLRTGPRRGELVIADIMHVPGSLGKKGENYFPYAQRFADVLETFVRGHPYQFFNFYNLWEP